MLAEKFGKMSSSEEEFEVESILNKRKGKGGAEYLVKWKGYPKDQSTWEPLANLSKVKDLVKQFEKKSGKKEKKEGQSVKSGEGSSENAKVEQIDSISEEEEEESKSQKKSEEDAESDQRKKKKKSEVVKKSSQKEKPKPKEEAKKSSHVVEETTSNLKKKKPAPKEKDEKKPQSSTQIDFDEVETILEHFEIEDEIYFKLKVKGGDKKAKNNIIQFDKLEKKRPDLMAAYFKRTLKSSS